MARSLFEAMLTPQAAPENASLRRLRYVWMALCTSLAIGVAAIRFVIDLFGDWGALGIFVLTIATPLHGLVYFRRKNAIDEAYAVRGPE